jgi:protease-4
MSRRLLFGIFAALLLCVGAGLVVRACGGGPMPRIAASRTKTVLEVDLDTSYPEGAPTSGIATLFAPPRTTLRELVETIDRAASDSSVAGIVARVGSGPSGLARAQEIRDAVRRFHSRRKFAWAWSETFGEGGNGTHGFYLASGFDQIFLQPSGDLWITGVALETPFFRGTLDKLGVMPQFGQRWEYKNAVNSYTEKELTPAHREALEKLKDSWYGQLVRGIAEGRKLSEEKVRAAIDNAPLLGTEAVGEGFVDALAYRDEVIRKALAKAGSDADLVSFGRYKARIGPPPGSGSLALVYGVGEVVRGRSTESPFSGTVTMGSDSVAWAIRSAVEDPSIRAIVFRVDSPGGSYVASDTIWREVARARDRGKPVIVSMGDVAGSGGYFVAIGADKIVAQPGTITGSIGVFAGKFVLTGLFEKLGLSFGEVHSGEHALLWDTTREFTPSERARFDAWLDRIYTDFTSKVAAGRKLPKERVLEIAKGRIWSGEDAKGLGLVDELGGMDAAIRLAKRAAHIPDTERVHLEVFPKPKTFWDTATDRFFGRSGRDEKDDDSDADTFIAAVRAIGPIARRLHAWGVDSPRGVLSTPQVRPAGSAP